MGEDLRALLKVIRRPMLRWWLTRGSWWVGTIIVLYAAAFLLQWQGSGAITPMSIVCARLALVLTVTAWIVAAWQTNAMISSVLVEFPHPREHEVRRARLGLCFAQGVVLLLAVAVLNAILQIQTIQSPEVSDTSREYHLWMIAAVGYWGLRNIWPIPFCMLWFVAILATNPNRPYLALPWTIPAIASPAFELAMFASLQLAMAQGTAPLIFSFGTFPYLHLAGLWVTGFCLMLYLIWDSPRNRRPLWWSVYTILLVSTIASIPVFHSAVFSADPEPRQPVVTAANVAGQLPGMALVHPLEFMPDSTFSQTVSSGEVIDQQLPTTGTLSIRTVYFGILQDLPNLCALVAFAGNLAWLAAQYFILAAVLGWRGQRTVQRESAQPTKG